MPAADSIPVLPDLLKQAEQLRPDLAAVGMEIRNADIALEGTRNALLPELDLVATVQSQGLAGQPVSTQSPTGATGSGTPNTAFSGGYGTALEQMLTQKYPSYEVGVQLTLPLRNRVTQADLTRDLLQKRAYQTQLIQLQNQAALEIDTATIAVRRARSAYEAAVRTRQL